MAITGLKRIEAAPKQIMTIKDDDVNAAVEALGILRLLDLNNKDAVKLATTKVRNDFEAAASSGVNGEPFIQLPGKLPNGKRLISLGEMITALDEGTFRRKYPKTYVYGELWTPGVGSEGYTEEQLEIVDGLSPGWEPHGRIAVYGAECEQDPLLHYLNLPFDEDAKNKYNPEAPTTQLEKLAGLRTAFEAQHQGFNTAALGARAIAFRALMQRIKDEPMPISCGFLRDTSLPRITVGGVSVVGHIYSRDGRFHLGDSIGRADRNSGVGISVGQTARLNS